MLSSVHFVRLSQSQRQARSCRDIPVENRWIVPYTPMLVTNYNAHINVDIVATFTVIEYLFKRAPCLMRPPAVWLAHGARASPLAPQHLSPAGTSSRALTAPCSSSMLELQTPRAPPQPNRV